ncbi:oligopeptide/dipeptide ABC transporter ATP-binding protein [Arthrobacter sp. V4I6]|uniref:ABC transporter ATP-binding protein n=1 Tax=unclassified Arthrobacter TaxID=235627 RepID=UPI0027810101|nr:MULTISPECIES: ABC transporter ATP-binding protein [unclassified Arthrobacter]MDQ0819487.1 oligopeptide/dipeptide ABC transporter ATP-binding protein [Arthrobacter sp. V1I7]MDQ0853669.1 oligopeptide/dipeptide ABC transporter ATP-binding protein [Arthrobacter sp. V4I6]
MNVVAPAEHEQMPNSEPIVQVRNVSQHFQGKSHGVFRRKHDVIKAVDDISVSVARGECLAIVGESGCGKSTLARVVVGLLRPTNGDVLVDGQSTAAISNSEMRKLRKRVQLVLQDPLASLDPRMTVKAILNEALVVHRIGTSGEDRHRRCVEVLSQVGLGAEFMDRFAKEMSGGQRQRVAIAKAISCSPDVLVLDEPVSALDVSVQAQIINLLVDLQKKLGLTYIIITHDLTLVQYIADKTCVMYLGAMVEYGDTADVWQRPVHPYTVGLISAVTIPDPAYEKTRHIEILPGTIPSASAVPSGCRFHTRCTRAVELGRTTEAAGVKTTSFGILPRSCVDDIPQISSDASTGHQIACHFAGVQPHLEQGERMSLFN